MSHARFPRRHSRGPDRHGNLGRKVDLGNQELSRRSTRDPMRTRGLLRRRRVASGQPDAGGYSPVPGSSRTQSPSTSGVLVWTTWRSPARTGRSLSSGSPSSTPSASRMAASSTLPMVQACPSAIRTTLFGVLRSPWVSACTESSLGPPTVGQRLNGCPSDPAFGDTFGHVTEAQAGQGRLATLRR